MNYSFRPNCYLLMVGLLGTLVFSLASCYELAPFPGLDAGGGDGDTDGDTDTDTDENPEGLSCADEVYCYSHDFIRECEGWDLHVQKVVGSCYDDPDGVGQCSYGPVVVQCTTGSCVNDDLCPDPDNCEGLDCTYPPVARYCKGDELHAWDGTPGECVDEPDEPFGCANWGETVRPCGAGKCVENPRQKGDYMCEDDPCAWLVCAMPPASYCQDDYTIANFNQNGTCNNGVCEYDRVGDTDCTETSQRCYRGTCKDAD
jgi:hypothetical protein